MIELKNIKVHTGLSEETFAYTGTVYFNGKKAVDVSNDGHGGADHQYPVDGADLTKIEKWCADNLPEITFNDIGGAHDLAPIPASLETFCSDKVAEHLMRRDMRRLLKSTALFVLDGALREMKYKGRGAKYTDELGNEVLRRHPTVTLLNRMPEDEALKIYSTYG